MGCSRPSTTPRAAANREKSRRRQLCRRARRFSWITIQAAKAFGLENRIGESDTGKKAGVLGLDARQLNMQPVHDPLASVVTQACIANASKAVTVAREWRKQERGRLLVDGMQSKIDALRASGQRIARSMGLQK